MFVAEQFFRVDSVESDGFNVAEQFFAHKFIVCRADSCKIYIRFIVSGHLFLHERDYCLRAIFHGIFGDNETVFSSKRDRFQGAALLQPAVSWTALSMQNVFVLLLESIFFGRNLERAKKVDRELL